MKNHWTIQPASDKAHRTIHNRVASIGRNCQVSNGVNIEEAVSFNGSGDKAFGGAKQWPAITMRIGFPEGEITQRDAFIIKLKAFVDENLPMPAPGTPSV